MKNGFANRIISKFNRRNPKNHDYPVLLENHNNSKTALLSYLSSPILLDDNDTKLSGHTNKWESREIAKILFELGYNVEVINFNDFTFIPDKDYDVVIDICYNIARLNRFFSIKTKKLLHFTGSEPFYQNQAELKRVAEVNLRKDGKYVAKRLVDDPHLATQSLELADHISLIGNFHTLSTFKEQIQKKITLVTVTASDLSINLQNRENRIPESREFLWFFGSGAVHKGLDRLLEIFSKNPDYTLNIVGNVEAESDFVEMYFEELYNKPNIHYYGYLLPDSEEFSKIIDRTFCFIAPTCSESISTAVATCLQIGLFPVISYDTGVTLPENCGIYLQTNDIQEILEKIEFAHQLDDAALIAQTNIIKLDAREKYSRDKFHSDMMNYLSKILLENGYETIN